MKRRNRCVVPAMIAIAAGQALAQSDAAVQAKRGLSASEVRLPSGGVAHRTENVIIRRQTLSVPGSPTTILLWDEVDGAGFVRPHFAISTDGGRSVAGRVRENTNLVELQYATFDPLQGEPPVDPRFAAGASSDLYLVQCVVWPLPEFRAGIEAAGGKVVRYLPENSLAVRMAPGVAAKVRELPFIRWVGAYHPAYKVDPKVLLEVTGSGDAAAARYSIECFERGMGDQGRVADAILAMGGIVDIHTPDQFRMEATLTPAQVAAVAQLNEVNWIEPWGGPAQYDMNNVRAVGGANYIETTLGFTGQGVRGEVFDSELRNTHTEFTLITPVAHSPTFDPGDVAHGTSSYSVVFARGADPLARGILPNAEEGYFYDDGASTQFGGAQTRLAANQQLVNPALAFQCVFQTSSVGSARTTTYTAISAEVDDYLFITRLLSTQSQSNAGWFTGEPLNNSRPQAWAKNIVSVGAVYHFNDTDATNDRWISANASCSSPSGSVSSGPASDGRIKPDLCFYNDCIRAATKTNDTAMTEFGGTSSATPMTAGHFGLFFQMWHEGVWKGRGGQSTVFASRAAMTTAKAALINTATQYNWLGGGANGDITRVRQGWGRPNLQTLYDRRNETFIVDEEHALAPLATRSYTVLVPPGQPSLNVTMCYADPQGNPAVQATHRVNDLSLRVVDPGGTVYWGNNGLSAALTSTSGGVSNTKDTVENVFIANPLAGVWRIEVVGDVITQDANPATAAVDAVFSIWATGCREETMKRSPVYGYSVQSNGNDRLYRIDMETGEAVDLGLVGNGDMEGLSFGPDGNLYGITGSATATTGQLWNISIPPGSQVGGSFARNGIDAGMDYFDGALFQLQGNNSTSSILYRINPNTGAPTLVGNGAFFGDNIAINTLGAAFAVDAIFNFTLYSVNLSNGAMAAVGPLGITGSLQGGTSFSADNILYLLCSDGRIFTINTATGAATHRATVTVNGVTTGGWEGLAIDRFSAAAPMELPAFGSTFSSGTLTRGYFFTAPYNGAIQGVRVPNEAGETIQNVEIVRFTAGAPPVFPTTTNSFVSLGRFDNQPANQVISCNIPVAAGDIIGVLGACGTTTMRNSYGPANPTFASSMKGLPVTLRRMGMQFNLFDNAARDLWTENASSVSRIELYYTDGRNNLYLNGDQPGAGSTLVTTPLTTPLGTTTWTNGELFANSGNDPEFIAAGAQGNCFDGLGSPANCELVFNFDVDSVSFIYGGNLGGITVEARNAANVVVDSFTQLDTFSGQPAGPRILAAPGIRRLRWIEAVSGSFAALDNIRIHGAPFCYPNCDGSTGTPLLTANDFQCFLNKFAAGDLYANCDGSTGTPALTANDFQCFLNKFAAGCS
ncbi:MAG: S8 family serine peptidase [Phycisphaeraceae bacterium]|nr:S8 family serine peptidase [Phycisphaeraceae bacterium]